MGLTSSSFSSTCVFLPHPPTPLVHARPPSQHVFLLLILLLNTFTSSSSSSTCVPPQVFIFRDYLPHIVGDEAMSMKLGRYPGYDPNVDPRIANVFSTAAYRFAHLAIQPMLTRLDENYQENASNPNVPLFKAFFSPWRVIFEGERRGHKVLARNMNFKQDIFLQIVAVGLLQAGSTP